jgi:hypothetical protein
LAELEKGVFYDVSGGVYDEYDAYCCLVGQTEPTDDPRFGTFLEIEQFVLLGPRDVWLDKF